MKLITWTWLPDDSAFYMQKVLRIKFKGRHAITVLTAISDAPDSWFVTSPMVFWPGGQVGVGMGVKEAAAVVRQVIAEMMAEEFAGVDR